MFERGSPEEAKYKELIFNKLASLGLENETLADYVVVMLANRKSRDHVASDLASIVGDELPTAFVPWLFDELLAEKVDAQSSAAGSTSAPAATVEQQTQSPVFTFHSGAAALDPEAAEFVPEEEEGLAGVEADAEMDTSGGGSGAAKPAKTPYRLLDKALREAATSKPSVPTPPASAAANARGSPRAAPYSVAGSKARQAKTVTETATTFTVTLAGESALERVEERPVRCVFWPDCAKGNECPFFHPSEVCCQGGKRSLRFSWTLILLHWLPETSFVCFRSARIFQIAPMATNVSTFTRKGRRLASTVPAAQTLAAHSSTPRRPPFAKHAVGDRCEALREAMCPASLMDRA